MATEIQPVPIEPRTANPRPTPSFMSYRIMGTITVIILAVDQATKHLVRTQVLLHDAIEVLPGFLNLVHIRNTGAAFGFLNVVDLAYKRVLMTSIALVALVAIGFYTWRVEAQETLSRAGLALILGGAIGNLIDRAAMGYVVDFIDVYWGSVHFWAFNVADSSITVGACLLIMDMFLATDDVSTSL